MLKTDYAQPPDNNTTVSEHSVVQKTNTFSKTNTPADEEAPGESAIVESAELGGEESRDKAEQTTDLESEQKSDKNRHKKITFYEKTSVSP